VIPLTGKYEEKIQKIDEAVNDRNFFKGYQRIRPKNSLILIFRSGGQGKQTIYLGDSNMQMYAPRILELVKNNKGKDPGVIFVTNGGVPPIPNITRDERPECRELIPLFEKIMTEEEVERVVVGAMWHDKFTEDSIYKINGKYLNSTEGKQCALESFDGLIRSIVDKKVKTFVILSSPSGNELDPKNFFSRSFFGIRFSNKKELTKSDFLQINGEVIQNIRKIALRNGCKIINPLDFLCKNGICFSELNGIPIYYDYKHLRPDYTRKNAVFIDCTLK